MRLAGRTDDEHCWNNPEAMASYDLDHWFRVPGTYQDDVYRSCWVMARQHPSETMSSFFV